MRYPTFEQLDDNDAVVLLSRKMAAGYKPSYEEAEIAYWAIAYGITLFFRKLNRE